MSGVCPTIVRTAVKNCMKNNFPFVMKSAAFAAVTLTALLVLAYFSFCREWMLTCAISTGTTAYHFMMRLAVGYSLPKLTNYDFDYRHRWFQPRKWEPLFYKKVNIKGWKANLPTYTPEQFSMKEHSLHRIIQNMCGAELVHEIIMVLSFAPLLAVPFLGSLPVFLITSILAAMYDGIFVMAQRFNRPRLVRIYEKKETAARE